MPKNADKLLEKMRASKTGWHANDLITVYSEYGFNIRSGKGSHIVISHAMDPQNLRAVVTDHGKELPPGYTRTLVALIDKLLGLQAAEENKDK